MLGIHKVKTVIGARFPAILEKYIFPQWEAARVRLFDSRHKGFVCILRSRTEHT